MLQTVVWAIISAAIISSCCNLTASDRVPNTLTHYFPFCKSLSSFFASLSLLHCRAPIIIETVGDCKQPVSCCSALLNDSPPLAYVTVCACVCYMPLLLLFIFSLSFSFPIHSLRRRCRLHFRLHCVHSFDSSSLFLYLFLCFFATRLMLEKAKASKRERENFEMGKGSHCMWMCVCVFMCVYVHMLSNAEWPAVMVDVTRDQWSDSLTSQQVVTVPATTLSALPPPLCAHPIQSSRPIPLFAVPLLSVVIDAARSEVVKRSHRHGHTNTNTHWLTGWVSDRQRLATAASWQLSNGQRQLLHHVRPIV